MDSNPDQVNFALQQLSAVACNGYDKYGRLDPNRVQLLVRGFYLSQEEAAALPSRITVCSNAQSGSRIESPRPIANREQSDRGTWTEEDTELLIRLHAQRMSFPEITEHFPGKSQKACQEKFYHAIKDPDHKWKHYHHDLRREHDEKKHK